MNSNQKRMNNVSSSRPIILLRRSSCGSLSNRRVPPTDNTMRSFSVKNASRNKLPRLNSMPDIKQNQRIINNPYGSQSSNMEQNFVHIPSGIKIEPYEDNTSATIWRHPVQNTTSNALSYNFAPGVPNVCQVGVNQAQNIPKNFVFNNNGCPQILGTLSNEIFQNQQFGRMETPDTIPIMRIGNGQVNCQSGLISMPLEQQYSNGYQIGKFYCGGVQGAYLENENIRPHSVPNMEPHTNCVPINVHDGCLSHESVSMASVHPGIRTNVVDDSLTNITWLGHMGVNNNFLPMQAEKNGTRMRHLPLRTLKGGRPPYSYMALIQFAINSSPTRRMTLRQIYLWIEESFPFFKLAKPGWKNSIRHNLSLHDIFIREVSATSKASFWTLRPDLNMRPLTLESVKGDAAQHMFRTCTLGGGSPWTIESTTPGQKPILPRPSEDSQPYVLVPLTDAMKGSICTPQSETSIRRTSSTRDCSSIFADSGFHSDISMMTPSTSKSRLSSGYEPFHYESTSGTASSILLDDQNVFSLGSTAQTENKGGTRKRPRKQPLKTLNDSLNNSLHFDETRLEHSPESERKPKRSSFISGPASNSFSDILNDLETPYKNLFYENTIFDREDVTRTPPHKKCKKLNYNQKISPGFNEDIDSILKLHNRDSPIRFCKMEKIDSPSMVGSSVIDNYKNGDLHPTSTPICDEKCGSRSLQSLTPSRFLRSSPGQSFRASKSKAKNLALSAFPTNENVLYPLNSSPKNNNKQNIVESNESPRANSKRDKLSNMTNCYHKSEPEYGGESSTTGFLPSVFGGDCLAFNTSFSKLLDLSGISLLGTSGCSPSKFSDIADVSWSNIPDT